MRFFLFLFLFVLSSPRACLLYVLICCLLVCLWFLVRGAARVSIGSRRSTARICGRPSAKEPPNTGMLQLHRMAGHSKAQPWRPWSMAAGRASAERARARRTLLARACSHFGVRRRGRLFRPGLLWPHPCPAACRTTDRLHLPMYSAHVGFEVVNGDATRGSAGRPRRATAEGVGATVEWDFVRFVDALGNTEVAKQERPPAPSATAGTKCACLGGRCGCLLLSRHGNDVGVSGA